MDASQSKKKERKKHSKRLKKSDGPMHETKKRAKLSTPMEFDDSLSDIEDNILESDSGDDLKLFSELVRKAAEGIISSDQPSLKKDKGKYDVSVSQRKPAGVPYESEEESHDSDFGEKLPKTSTQDVLTSSKAKTKLGKRLQKLSSDKDAVKKKASKKDKTSLSMLSQKGTLDPSDSFSQSHSSKRRAEHLEFVESSSEDEGKLSDNNTDSSGSDSGEHDDISNENISDNEISNEDISDNEIRDENKSEDEISHEHKSDDEMSDEDNSDGEISEEHNSDEEVDDAADSETPSDASESDTEGVGDVKVAKQKKTSRFVTAERPRKSGKEKVKCSETQDDLASIRKKLSNLPFEDLQKMKEKIGLKTYNEVMFGRKREKRSSESKMRDEPVFKRTSKNQPMEISSKVPVSRFKPKNPVKRKVHRDPRFDDLSGEYNPVYFKKNYGFIDDIKKREKQMILEELKEEKDEERRKKMKYLIHRMTQQEKAARKEEQSRTHLKKWKNQEREKIKEGKKPFYLKQSEKKKLELADKYRELKKTGQVEKYLSKKRKKNASKAKRKLPKNAFS